MIIGPAISNAIIDKYGWYTADPLTGEVMLNYPYEMFLGAAIVSVFTIIPAIIVMRKEPELRARLIAERDAANATETGDSTDDVSDFVTDQPENAKEIAVDIAPESDNVAQTADTPTDDDKA